MLTSPTPLRDSDLRTALAATIARKYRGRDHLLTPEVDILCGIPGRIDALLITSKICGFEIKSDVDSLHRLPRQLEAYEPVLERAVLIVGRRHLEAAQKILPPWWGIWLAERRGPQVALSRRRTALPNPDFYLYAVTTFIARDVITLHLRTQGIKGYSKYDLYELRGQLIAHHSRAQVLALARWVMRSRVDWRNRAGAIMHPPNPAAEDFEPRWMSRGRTTTCQCPICMPTTHLAQQAD